MFKKLTNRVSDYIRDQDEIVKPVCNILHL